MIEQQRAAEDAVLLNKLSAGGNSALRNVSMHSATNGHFRHVGQTVALSFAPIHRSFLGTSERAEATTAGLCIGERQGRFSPRYQATTGRCRLERLTTLRV